MTAPAKLFCPRCFRVDDDLGPDQCGSGILGCPEPLPFEATKETLITCGPCGITRALPVEAVVRGKGAGHTCVSSVCQATVVCAAVPAVAAAQMAPLGSEPAPGVYAPAPSINQGAAPRSPKKPAAR